MYVTVIHRISDPDGWRQMTEQAMAQGLPPGFSLPIHAATAEGNTEVCIWDVPSVEALQQMLEPGSKGLAVNEYLVTSVDGLPVANAL